MAYREAPAAATVGGEGSPADQAEYEQVWEKGLKAAKAPGTGSNNTALLAAAVSNLTAQIITSLRNSREEGEHDDGGQASKNISRFLFGKGKSSGEGIDNCIRWAILYDAAKREPAADSAESHESNAPTSLVGIILDQEKGLAFETLGPRAKLVEDCKCRGKSHGGSEGIDHSKLEKEGFKGSPFHNAVKSAANAGAIKSMIDHMRLYCQDQARLPKEQRRRFPFWTSPSSENAEELLLKALQEPVKGYDSKVTVLWPASTNDLETKGQLETLAVLLQHPGITQVNYDKTFEKAMLGGRVRVIEAFLGNQELRNKYANSENIIKAMDSTNQDSIQEYEDDVGHFQDIERRRRAIVNLLLECIDEYDPRSNIFDNAVAQKIIELNLVDAWEKRPRKINQVTGALDETNLLHSAVYHQRLDFVRMFIDTFSSSVAKKALVPNTERPRTDNGNAAVKAEGHYPLWYNRKVFEGSGWVDRPKDKTGVQQKIRNELVLATIRQVEKMQRLSGIFRESEEQVDELCFEISQFNSKAYRVSEFVHSLINHRENSNLLSYEPTIKYARFPALGVHVDDKEEIGKSTREEHREVFDALHWLREDKGVETILELAVPDRLVNPHNEVEIAKVVDEFKVERLNWRYLDLSLSVFQEDGNAIKPRIRELHLYSSGKRAAISHWFSDEGLITLVNLRNVRIHVIQDMMPKQYSDDTVDYIEKKMRKFERAFNAMKSEAEKRARLEPKEPAVGLRRRGTGEKPQQDAAGRDFQHNKRQGNTTLKWGVNSQLWNPAQERLASLDELAQRAFPRLSGFIFSYRNYVNSILGSHEGDPEQPNGVLLRSCRRTFVPTKVAIIDNGILSISRVPADTPSSINGKAHKGKSKLTATKGMQPAMGSIKENHQSTSQAYTNGAPAQDPLGTDDESKKATGKRHRDRFSGGGTLWSRIKDGQSFVDDEHRVSPWMFASDPHGTQMANLICALDPACELYVAKATDGNKYGTSSERVVRAVKWAIEKKVDIISMSFSILEYSPQLEEVINKAKDLGIIMMCSNHDEGANIENSWPSNFCPRTWVVTACDEYGFTPRNVKSSAQTEGRFRLQGNEIAAGVIHFLESHDRISGSSVATAIASGLCSLILSCARLNTCHRDGFPVSHGESCSGQGACVAKPDLCEGKNRRTVVSHYLKQMFPKESEGYVRLEKFGGIDTKVKEGEDIFVDEILRHTFSPEAIKEAVEKGKKQGS